jgi:hypothetical protein
VTCAVVKGSVVKVCVGVKDSVKACVDDDSAGVCEGVVKGLGVVV